MKCKDHLRALLISCMITCFVLVVSVDIMVRTSHNMTSIGSAAASSARSSLPAPGARTDGPPEASGSDQWERQTWRT